MDKEILDRLNAECHAVGSQAERLRVEISTLRGDEAVSEAQRVERWAAEQFAAIGDRLAAIERAMELQWSHEENIAAARTEDAADSEVVDIVEVKADPEPAPQWPTGPTFDPR